MNKKFLTDSDHDLARQLLPYIEKIEEMANGVSAEFNFGLTTLADPDSEQLLSSCRNFEEFARECERYIEMDCMITLYVHEWFFTSAILQKVYAYSLGSHKMKKNIIPANLLEVMKEIIEVIMNFFELQPLGSLPADSFEFQKKYNAKYHPQ